MTPQKFSPNPRRGVALVIVLAMLVLLSGLIVAFFNSVRTERNATKADSSVANARTIADSTVNMVIAQIREATTRYTDRATWASQPGAIRTFSGKQNSQRYQTDKGAMVYPYEPGSSDYVYKLYSADRMRVKAEDYNIGGQDLDFEINAIQKWLNDPLIPLEGYVDMNEPFVSRFPDPGTESGFRYEPRYPILDPRARGDATEKEEANLFGIVEGFDAATIINPTDERRTSSNRHIPMLPMPVKWLYVLKDGSIGEITNATEDNPVVGRTAFWTDDETTKLNINIASEGTFWDTPAVSTSQESGEISSGKTVVGASDSLALAVSQPLRGEYQRYPGHPATTCLSPVMGWMWDLPRQPLNFRDTRYINFKEAIYRMAPFTMRGRGTSMGGSDNPDRYVDSLFNTQGDPKVETLTKHLYNNVDEYIFQAERFDTSGALLHDTKLSAAKLEKVRGFITANSRASELNSFNRPRVTIWPLNADEKKRTNYDNLFAFASSLGKKPNDRLFSFERTEAKSPTIDVNLDQNKYVLAYLQWLTGGTGTGPTATIPGFGPNFTQKYSTTQGYSADARDQLLTLIFDYVRCTNLVDTGTSRIGTLRFIPYTPFFGQGQAGYGVSPRSFDWSGQVTPTEVPSGHPLKAGLKGMGRFLTISEAGIAFYRTGNMAPAPEIAANQKQTGLRAMFLVETATTMAGYPALRDTYYTVLTVTRDFRVTPIFPDGSPLPTAVNVPIFRSDTDVNLINIVNVSSLEFSQGRSYLPTLGFMNPLMFYPEHRGPTNPANYPNDPNRNTTTTIAYKNFGRAPGGASQAYARNTTLQWYPYVGPDPSPQSVYEKGIPIYDPTKKFATQFDFEPGAIRVDIYAGECPRTGNANDFAELVQTVNLDFAAGLENQGGKIRLKMPEAVANRDCDIRTRLTTPHNTNAGGRPNQDGKTDFFRLPTANTGDYVGNEEYTTVRTLEFIGPAQGMNPNPAQLAQQGDLRIGASLKNVPSSYYYLRDPVAARNGNDQIVHGFNTGHADYNHLTGHSISAQLGVLAKGSRNYKHSVKYHLIPAGIDGVQNSVGGPGDWDRGLSKHLDGALGNKVDEGNVWFDYSQGTVSYRAPYFRGRGLEETGQSFFSPNRQLSSPVMFGSLPAGVNAAAPATGKPWQTLLFRPDRSTVQHPGGKIPEDHLLLDFFHIPIVEPYSISEPFSTAGKVNLNYIMAPFGYVMTGKNLPKSRSSGGTAAPASYIHRDTALRGVLRSTKMMAVNTTAQQFGHTEDSLADSNRYRFEIDGDETIAHIQKRLLDPKRGLFRSASEICTVDLYPVGLSVSNWQTFWDTTYAQTGDNMRERPYSFIYPRVTTKSNVYTVHMRCQAIQISPTARKEGKIDYANVEEKDIQVQAEYRGSSIIERFVDPNDTELERYEYTQSSVDPYYRFRVISTKQFNPR
ncbi:MAG TPA: Verru_Chthon cassette protein A [Chthoniobacteraceae bacterium]|nr:Verru_Chthon cassette protein A [Chthoniobacteraceae bacterium]